MICALLAAKQDDRINFTYHLKGIFMTLIYAKERVEQLSNAVNQSLANHNALCGALEEAKFNLGREEVKVAETTQETTS